jgi:hypothetical protein
MFRSNIVGIERVAILAALVNLFAPSRIWSGIRFGHYPKHSGHERRYGFRDAMHFDGPP